MGEKFNLKSDNFEQDLASNLKSLRREEDYYDVTLMTEDLQHFKAHKLILGSVSQFFKNTFKHISHPNPLIYLNDVSSKILNNILDYVYEGVVEVCEEDIEKFLDFAFKLKIHGLIPNENSLQQQKGVNTSKTFHETKSEHVKKKPSVENINSDQKPKVDVKQEQREYGLVALPGQKNESLNESLAELMSYEEGGWSCKACGKVFTIKHNLKRHAEIHVEGIQYECKQCHKVMSNKTAYHNHTSRVHRT